MDKKFTKINVIVKVLETNLEILKLKKGIATNLEQKKEIAKQVRLTKKAMDIIKSIKHDDILDSLYRSLIEKNEFWFCLVANVVSCKKTIYWDKTENGYKEFVEKEEQAKKLYEEELEKKKKIEQAKKEGKKIEYMVDPTTKKTIPIIMENGTTKEN